MTSQKTFHNEKCWRIIPSCYPTINLFERVVEADDLEAVFEIEALTNDRLRDEVGNLSLVKSEDRISGPNTSYIMAAFTHLNPHGSRFSDGTWGVYYAAFSLETSIAETKYHRAKFLSFTKEDPIHIDMRVLSAKVSGDLNDISTPDYLAQEIYHPENYAASQGFARHLKESNANGLFYQSVRHKSGQNIAVFKPRLLKNCVQEQHLEYVWNGFEISAIFEKKLLKAS